MANPSASRVLRGLWQVVACVFPAIGLLGGLQLWLEFNLVHYFMVACVAYGNYTAVPANEPTDVDEPAEWSLLFRLRLVAIIFCLGWSWLLFMIRYVVYWPFFTVTQVDRVVPITCTMAPAIGNYVCGHRDPFEILVPTNGAVLAFNSFVIGFAWLCVWRLRLFLETPAAEAPKRDE